MIIQPKKKVITKKKTRKVGGSEIVSLSNSPAKIVQYLLVQLGLGVIPPVTGTVASWPVYAHQKIVNAVSKIANPVNAVIVYDTSGHLDGRVMLTGIETEHYGIMIHTRDQDPEVAEAYGYLIKDTLLQSVYRVNVTVPVENNADGNQNPGATYFIQCLTQTSSVVPLGAETQNRWSTSSVNFTITLWEVDA